MTPIVVALVMLALTVILVIMGLHISVALLSTGIVGLMLIIGDFGRAVRVLGTGPFYSVFNYEFSVIPLFVLMGLFANASGASKDLYDAGFKLFGRVKGGLGIVTVISNAVFAAVTGVSIASAAVFGKIAVPEMRRYGYSMKFSTGCVAGSSALGMLIPPSLLFIVYGLLSGESIGTMFIAGIIPGLILAATYSIAILVPKCSATRPSRRRSSGARNFVPWANHHRSAASFWWCWAESMPGCLHPPKPELSAASALWW